MILTSSHSLQAASTQEAIPKDFSVTLDRTGCFGRCPTYKLTISHDGSVIFDGGSNVAALGIVKSTMALQDVESLVAVFHRHDFFSLRDHYQSEADGCKDVETDMPFVISSLTMNGRTKSVSRYLGCVGGAPLWLQELENDIERMAHSEPWVRMGPTRLEAESAVQQSTEPQKHAEALYHLGEALYREQSYNEAIRRWKELIDDYKSSPWRLMAHLKSGQTHFGLGQYDKAIGTYEQLIQNYPKTPEAKEANFQLIQCYYSKADLAGAYRELRTFKKAYPSDDRISMVCNNLLASHQAQPTPKQLDPLAVADLMRSVHGNGSASIILWERGAGLFNKKDYSTAQKYFQRIILSYPKDEYASQASFYNAECYYYTEAWEQAASAYKDFCQRFPKDSRVPGARKREAECRGKAALGKK